MTSSVLRGRYVALLTCFGIAVTAISTPAEARYRHFRHHAGAYQPPFAAMVVDANTGKVLYARNENELRHPASLTKVMTLYLLFEQLERGKLTMESELKISAHAASQQPSKLGLEVGETIGVEDAIKAIVTRSANDVAVAIAENIGGDEETFAGAMTRKAHQLGMSKTTYQNASGLPNQDQVTTARDLTILGRAIQDRFPKYYRYFSTHHFDYAGNTILNHNKLLGRVEGVDGIKTGFTNASGFNLLTSVKRDGHALVASVLGGRTGRERDVIMTGLIEDNIEAGSTRRTVAAIGDKPSGEAIKIASADPIKIQPVDPLPILKPVGKPNLKPQVRADQASADNEDEDGTEPESIKPVANIASGNQLSGNLVSGNLASGKPLALVAAQATPDLPKARPAVLSATPKAVALDDTKPATTAKPVPLDGSTKARPLVAQVAAATPPRPAMRWVQGPAGVANAASAQLKNNDKSNELRPPAKIALAYAQDETPTASLAPRLKAVALKDTGKNTTNVPAAAETPAPAHTGWMIQIGAADDVNKANALLSRAKSESKGTLASASPFTEKVQKGDITLYRARFAGLEADEATNACKRLKQSGFACFPTKN